MSNDSKELWRLADEAAETIYNTKIGETPAVFEPPDIESARAATKHLGKLFDNIPGSIQEAASSWGSRAKPPRRPLSS